ncbi:aminoglycoside 6-adenylyltransferase [Carnobacterium viridans]|nr:aminoglycoside 6-adenylyltransferase [Carnobacterium viridans]
MRLIEMNGPRITLSAKIGSFQDDDIMYYVENRTVFSNDHS